jgi:hypothetical protein
VELARPRIFEHFCANILARRALLHDDALISGQAQMKRDQLLRQLNRDAKAAGLDLIVNMARGKGGHCVVRCGEKFSVVKSGEITPTMERVIRKQLGL